MVHLCGQVCIIFLVLYVHCTLFLNHWIDTRVTWRTGIIGRDYSTTSVIEVQIGKVFSGRRNTRWHCQCLLPACFAPTKASAKIKVLLKLGILNNYGISRCLEYFDLCNESDAVIFNRPQRSWAKVMFLQASVILSTGGGGVCLSACWDTTPWSRPPLPGEQTPPLEQTPPRSRPPQSRQPPGADTPPREQTPPPPPGSRFQHNTVNERPVRILLECILVPSCVPILLASFRVLISVFFKHLRWYDNQFQSSCLSISSTSRKPTRNHVI